MGTAIATPKLRKSVLTSPAITSHKQVEEWGRCRCDPIRFINNYCWIIDPTIGQIPFRLYGFQRALIRALFNNWANLVLKPRQFGISWIAAAIALWVCIFAPDKNVLMVSMNAKRARRLLDRVRFMYKHLPPFLRCGVLNGDGIIDQDEFARMVGYEKPAMDGPRSAAAAPDDGADDTDSEDDADDEDDADEDGDE